MCLQLLINIVVTAVTYFLIAISFSVIYRTVRFFHFAHGVILVLGAYFVLLLGGRCKLDKIYSIPLAISITALIAMLNNILIYKPIRIKKGSSLILLLSSLGIYIVLQNVISVVFGDSVKIIRNGEIQSYEIAGAFITPVQVITVIVSILLIISLYVFLKTTKLGLHIRAVSNSSELASISGISTNKIYTAVFAIGSSIAAFAGILIAYDVDITPTMGMNYLMMGVVAVIIGGVNSIIGVALGALLLAMAQHLGAWFMGSQWQDAIAFMILVIFLLLKPEGFFGEKVKSATV